MTKDVKTLVVYFSHSGNTKSIADRIAARVNADVVRIETVVPYSGTAEEISAQGKREVESGYKPEIKPLDVNPAGYDRIVVGTPTWWYTMAPAVATFFSNTDLSGKDVVLYMTNAGWLVATGFFLLIFKKKRISISVINYFYVKFKNFLLLWKSLI